MLIIFVTVKIRLTYSTGFNFFNWLGGELGPVVNFSILEDPYTVEFSAILLFLGLLIQWYSYFYFKKDPDLSRFSLLLGFFISFMLLMINTLS